MNNSFEYEVDALNESVIFHTDRMIAAIKNLIGVDTINKDAKMEIRNIIRQAVQSGWTHSANCLANSIKIISSSLIDKQFSDQH